MLSSVCDGWQPLEASYRVSGRCIKILAQHDWPVSVLTKSALLREDLQLLEGKRASIGVTLTTLDERLRGVVEPGASPTIDRIEVLREAAGRGISVYAFLGPFLPMLTDTEENIASLFAAVAPLPLTHIHTDRVNFRSGVAASLRQMAAQHFPELVDDYRWLGSSADEDRAYADQLRLRIDRLADKCGVSGKLR